MDITEIGDRIKALLSRRREILDTSTEEFINCMELLDELQAIERDVTSLCAVLFGEPGNE